MYEILDRENSFYKKGKERHFLAYRSKEPLARLAAMVNPDLPQSPPMGLFGFFECRDDLEGVEEIFKAALAWLCEQGCTQCRGPIDRNAWLCYRVMTQGFREQPIYLEPYNKTWYPKHLEEIGFKACAEYISAINVQPERVVEEFAGGVTFAERNGVSFRTFDMDKFDAEMKLLYDIFHASVDDEYGYGTLEFSSFKARYEKIKELLDPRVIIIALAPNGKGAGYILGMPECSRPIASMGGKRGVFSKIQYWLNKRQRSPILNYSSPKIVPAARGKGMTNGLKAKLYQAAIEASYTRTHYRTVRKDKLIQRPEEDAKVIYKEYSLYAKDI